MSAETVHRIYYEVVGDGIAVAATHYAKIDECRAAGMALAARYGAVGFRPNHSHGILHLIFAGGSTDAPEGFKYAQLETNKRIACSPHKGTKLGKQIAAELKNFECPPGSGALAAALGYSVPSAPMDGYKIYFPTAYRFLFPEERVYLDIPRQAGDGWDPPAHLREVPASSFMLAMEAHNAEVRRQQEAAEAEAA